MERTLFSLALAILLPITQLSAQDRSSTDRDAAMKEAIEAQKRAAIEEGRSRDQTMPPEEQPPSPRDNNTVTHQYFFKADSLSQEDWEEAQRQWWGEVARSSQEAMRAYGDAVEELYNNARKEIEGVSVAGRGGYYNSFGMPNDNNFMFYGDYERTTWDYSKTMVDDSFSTESIFDVDAETKTFIISVSGDCRAGKITIKVVMPDGKSYPDLAIDEFGNLNWRKTFNISETENPDKVGSWKFKIDATGVTGHFKISAQTF